MPFILLLAIALCSGLLMAVAFARFAPSQGVSAAAAEAIENVDEAGGPPSWWQRRLDPEALTGLALSAAVAVMIAGGFVVALLAFLVRGHEGLRSIDSSAATWGNEHASSAPSSCSTSCTGRPTAGSCRSCSSSSSATS
jgi:hypothetical protein